jgi:hypothetical protein
MATSRENDEVAAPYLSDGKMRLCHAPEVQVRKVVQRVRTELVRRCFATWCGW